MDKFSELRNKYPIFEYNSYKISDRGNMYEVEFNFNIPNLTEFNPRWQFPKPSKKIDEKLFNLFKKAVFNLGMVEVISYLKCVCSSRLIVKAGSLDQNQINWFKKLYVNGLGEFFYVNNFVKEMNIESFLNIEVVKENNNSENEVEKECKMNLHGNLIPVGGGKDSALTLEVLKEDKDINMCYIVNPRGASYESAKIAGYEDSNIYCPKRFIDEKLIELNKRGFLNGHTPFSAIVAFSSYASAILNGKKYIVLSNEDSANEVNIIGTNINHQYSKSIEFEDDFRYYTVKYICQNGPEYFSLLRPISEWQIVKGFTKNPKYYEIFKSCNVGSKEDIWCENCPKCLYVYIMLLAFLENGEMQKIFKSDMLENEHLRDIFNGLVYPDYNKPFECVGTKEEIKLSLDIIVQKYIEKGEELPVLLNEYVANLNTLDKRIKKAIFNFNNRNNLPEKYVKLLKEYII